jgi:WD40 repeat protein
VNLLLDAPASPFKGLAPFGDSDLDALLFFGRELEREIVVANLMASRFTVLYGPSGVGKSSLLGAGVVHEVRKIPDVAIVVFSAWAGDPVVELKEAIAETCDLGYSAGSLADTLTAATSAVGGEAYVILDQFEEFFLYHRGKHGFIEEVAEAVRLARLRANFLIGMREDALALLDAFKPYLPSFFANSLRLGPLDRKAGEAAIVGPVNAYNGLIDVAQRVELEPEVVTQVLDQVAAGKVDLGRAGRGSVGNGGVLETDRIEAPYLQLVLERLWQVERGAGSNRLRASTLRELGGAAQIVQDHLARAMSRLSPQEQDAAAAMYHHLVTPSGTKIAHGVSDLAGYAGIDEAEAASVLQRLSADRIVRAGENGGSGRYEIFHDVLADAVVAWRTQHEADRALEEQRRAGDKRHRRLVVVAVASLAALCLVAALAVYALVQRSDARHQAALADAQRAAALHQQHVAEQEKAEALHQKNSAKHAAAVAHEAQHKEEAAQQEATQQAASANAQRAIAEQQKSAADAARQQAQANADLARIQAARATTQQHLAQRNALLERRQKGIVQARALLASAKALLDENTEASLKDALRAVTAFRAAGLKSDRELEFTLRRAFLDLNLTAVLPGGGPVRSAAISPDGSRILVAGVGGVRLFDRAHGLRMRRLQPHLRAAKAIFSPDSRLVAAASGNDVQIWDAATGVPLHVLSHPGAVLSLAFSPDNRLLATGSADGKARLWDVATGSALAEFAHPRGSRGNAVQMVSFSPDSRRLMTVGGDRFARVFDVATHEQVLTINNTALINVDRFSHNGAFIATAGSDPFVKVWDAVTGAPISVLRQLDAIDDVAFSPDDTLLATASTRETTARVWDLQERAAAAIFTRHLSGVQSVSFTPDGKSVVSTARDDKVYLWAADSGFLQAAFLGHHGPVTDASFSPDGNTLVTGSDDGTARLWDAARQPPAKEIGSHSAAVNAVAFSPNGRRLLSAGADNTARIWGPGSSVVTLSHDGPVTAGSFSRDGNTVLTASSDRTARIWRVRDGKLITTLPHGAPLAAAELSPSGRLAVTAGKDGSAEIWDARRGVMLHRLVHTAPVNDAHFSPDGSKIVTASDDRTAAIWRVSDGKRLRTLSGHTGSVVAANFSPNGRYVATASKDDTARIYDLRSAKARVLEGHTADLTSIAFSPDSSMLATSSIDDDARVWNVRSGNQIALLRIHSGPVSDVTFSSDGRWLATAGPVAVGIWETRKTGAWPARPLYLVHGPTKPINDVAFSERGWRILMGSRDGSVRTFDCTACTGIDGLTKLARARLREIARPKP